MQQDLAGRPAEQSPVTSSGRAGAGGRRPVGMWGRTLRRLTGQDPSERGTSGPTHDQVRAHQCSPVGQTVPRTRVQLLGVVKTVSMVERPGHQWLEATIADCTGTITLVWMAQNTIKGLQPGRTVRVCGRVATDAGRPVIYNPEYDLLD